ncbi:MAG TPA: phosphatidate cytidylyltransferase [Bryobacteraceae bacterium]|nr:phosphatidate cytidylyltransferase [Bryobacteraceae bacterium]
MKRVVTALALIPIVVYVVLWANFWIFLAVLAGVACLCYREFDGIAAGYGYGAPGPMGYGAGLLLLVVDRDAWILLTAVALVSLALAMRAENLGTSLPGAALRLMGIVYIFGTWKCAIPLRDRNAHWLMFALLVNWAGDIGAYYVGRGLGRHRLAQRISPKKTWEGAAGSVVASALIAGGYLLRFVGGLTVAQVLAVTVAANVAGQVGDLAESAMKRGANVKDSGTLLPGHGGMLDRVDSTLFALPVVYAYLRFVG